MRTKPIGFEPTRNIAGFDPNPVPYVLNPSEAFKIGDMVKLDANGHVTKVAAADTSVLGIMAETVTADATAVTYGSVYNNPLTIFSVAYTGAAVPVAGGAYTVGADSRSINADDTTGGKQVIADYVDTANGIMNVFIKKHLYT